MYFVGKTSERIEYRKLDLSYLDEWKKFFEDEEPLKYLGIDLSLTNEQQAKDWIERQIWRYNNDAYGLHALIQKESGKFIGLCGLLTQDVGGKMVLEIGYHLMKVFRGKGYASEAARTFRDFAFKNNLADELVSIIHIQNEASQQVALRNGMKRGEQVKYNDLDVYLYRISRKEWEAIHS